MKLPAIEEMQTITQKELENDADAIVEKVSTGLSPLRVLGEDGNNCIMMSWSQYLEFFGELYTSEEIAEIEKGCRELWEEEMREEYDFSNARKNPNAEKVK